MPDYRRDRIPGGTFFFTVNLLDWRSSLLTAHLDGLCDAVRRVRAQAALHIDAWSSFPTACNFALTMSRTWRANAANASPSSVTLKNQKDKFPSLVREGEPAVHDPDSHRD
jgi:hypothetical protein